MTKVWSVPVECYKCCWHRRKDSVDPIHFDFEFKLNGVDKSKLIRDYQRLKYGSYSTRNIGGCCSMIGLSWRTLLFLLYFLLLLPFCFSALLTMYIIYAIIGTCLVMKTIITACCCKNYAHSHSELINIDDWSLFTAVVSDVDRRRFTCYKMPLYLFQLPRIIYWKVCQYLAGFFCAHLISDDAIIYFVHLWPTTTAKFVYSDDGNDIIGITEDYSSWSSNESVAQFHEGWTFEILSVYIDYEDECRITLNLRNGESIKQPRFNQKELTEEALNELRVWNIVKAHYQCMLSIWPAIVHTWVHFHFNDLTIQFMEDSDANNALNALIRAHTYYTASLNAAGMSAGYLNPHYHKNLGDVSTCYFLMSPWKATPSPIKPIGAHVAADVTKHYFVDCANDIPMKQLAMSPQIARADQKSVELVVAADENKKLLPVKQQKYGHQKKANPDAFPPKFVQLRLEMFSDKESVKKHRGFAVYKDYLADNYRVIYEDFVLPLNEQKFVKNKDLKEWIDYMEVNGFPGIVKCKRPVQNGNYLHIFATFLWLNVVHSSDHTIADQIIASFGIGASHVPFESLEWYKEHKEYDYKNVLEGKDCLSRWKLQFYAMRNQLFWKTHGGPRTDYCFVAHHFVDSNLYRRFVDVDNITNEQRRDLNNIHREFIEKLREVGAPFHWLMNVEDITAGIHY